MKLIHAVNNNKTPISDNDNKVTFDTTRPPKFENRVSVCTSDNGCKKYRLYFPSSSSLPLKYFKCQSFSFALKASFEVVSFNFTTQLRLVAIALHLSHPRLSFPNREDRIMRKGKSVFSGGSATTPVTVTSNWLLKLNTLFSADSFPKYFLASDAVSTTVFSFCSASLFPSIQE